MRPLPLRALPFWPGRLGSRLCAMRSMTSLCRHKWRSASLAKCTAGLTRHCSSSCISRCASASGARPARQRLNSPAACSRSLSLSRETRAQALLAARGCRGSAGAGRFAESGISSRDSSMPSNFSTCIATPNIRTSLCDVTGRFHSTCSAPDLSVPEMGSQLTISAVRSRPKGMKTRPSPSLLRVRMTCESCSYSAEAFCAGLFWLSLPLQASSLMKLAVSMPSLRGFWGSGRTKL